MCWFFWLLRNYPKKPTHKLHRLAQRYIRENMKQISNVHVTELQGYLNCIARLCANGYAFGVSVYEKEEGIDQFASKIVEILGQGNEYIESSVYEYFGCEKVESKFLFKELESFIFNGVLERSNMVSEEARNYTTKMLIEDFNEYYGLLSTSLNKDGVFHPLLRNEINILNIRNVKYERSLYFLVQIENVYVLTSFVKKVH